MDQTATEKKKTRKITLEVDLNAKLTGFESAKAPTRAHRRVMRNYSSPLLLGPPPGEKLLAMVTHMFSDEEADVAQHLRPLVPLGAGILARLCGRTPETIQPILDNLAENKRVIFSFGKPARYTILPLVPGLFEMVIVSPDPHRSNRWHKRFAELFESVWDSEFFRDYIGGAPPPVRYLPTQRTVSKLQAAWPTDKLDELLEPYTDFGIAHCQCRVVTQLAGNGCGKPTENCVSMGAPARMLIDRGYMRRVDRSEVMEAKRTAEENGCVTWIMNGRSNSDGNISCSCCGCCCHALRSITQFNLPGLFSAPHFRPRPNRNQCNLCGACSVACPMGAWKTLDGALHYEPARCIGCGLCVTACKKDALELREAPDAARHDEKDEIFMLKTISAYAGTAFKVWLRRATGVG